MIFIIDESFLKPCKINVLRALTKQDEFKVIL